MNFMLIYLKGYRPRTLCLLLFMSAFFLFSAGAVRASRFEPSTCGDQDPIRLSLPGYPSTPTRVDIPYPLTDFEFDTENYDVFQKTMHGRLITVAIGKDVDFLDAESIETAEQIFFIWSIYWREFGGFSFPSYTYVIGRNVTQTNDSGVGVQINFEIDKTALNRGHAIFHAWNGQELQPDSRRFWFAEGATVYMDSRMNLMWPYSHTLPQYAYWYQQILDDDEDRPLYGLIHGAPDYDHGFAAQKGCLVSYLIDKELKKYDHNFGHVLRLLHRRFGINNGDLYTTEDILQAINDVSGQDFTDFFNNYIYGTVPLPIDPENIEWICHDNWINSYAMPWLPLLLD